MIIEADGLPDHFLMGPSKASRWLKCSGSLNHPDDSEAGPAAIVGKVCHSIAESQLTDKPLNQVDQQYFDGLSAFMQVELMEAVTDCVDFVKGMPFPIKRYETKIPSYFVEEHGGTVDVIATDEQTLHVVDFKFGRGNVCVENNEQLGCYLNLARQLYPNAKKFYGTILQPFNGGQKGPHEFTTKYLNELEGRTLRASIEREYIGGDHCTFCPIISTCKAAAKYIRDQVSDFPDLTAVVADAGPKPSDAEVELLVKLYRTHKIAESASDGAASILKNWARRGVDIQKYGLGVRFTLRHEWNDNAEKVLDRLNVSKGERGEYKLYTPAQLREKLGLSKEAFEADFKDALNFKEVETLVVGRGGKADFSEFPDLG